jgi:hypothetical protein
MNAKATLITPNSSNFLQYYIAKTAPLLASVPSGANAFITHLIPLAYSDDLVMHCLMALGGVHLGSFLCKSRPMAVDCFCPTDADMAVHYLYAMRGVRFALADSTSGSMDREKVLRTLMVVLLMAELEVR